MRTIQIDFAAATNRAWQVNPLTMVLRGLLLVLLGLPAVVEACTGLANPAWSPLQTNTLSGDSFYFSDAQWTNYPARFYRLHWP